MQPKNLTRMVIFNLNGNEEKKKSLKIVQNFGQVLSSVLQANISKVNKNPNHIPLQLSFKV